MINGGSIGGGGTGNLADGQTDVGLARMSYDIGGGFEPLAVDLVGDRSRHRRGDRDGASGSTSRVTDR